MDLLCLVGYEFAERDYKPATTLNARKRTMLEGLQALKKSTRVDFGFDPEAWRQFLIEKGNEFGYTHPYAFKTVDKTVRSAAANPDVIAALRELASSHGNKPHLTGAHDPVGDQLSSEGLALEMVEALIKAGVVERQRLMSAVSIVRQEINAQKLLGRY